MLVAGTRGCGGGGGVSVGRVEGGWEGAREGGRERGRGAGSEGGGQRGRGAAREGGSEGGREKGKGGKRAGLTANMGRMIMGSTVGIDALASPWGLSSVVPI